MTPAFRRTAVLIGLLMTAATAADAQGTHFSSFRTERFDVWNDVPAYRARTYIAGAWGVLRTECRLETPSNSDLLDVAGYAMLPAAERFGMGGGVFRLQVVAEDNVFLVQADSDRDVRAFVRGSSCAPAAHRAWLAATEKFLGDPRLGGSMQSFALAACNDSSTPRPGTDCGCFARALDMEASPARRRALLDAADVRAAFRQALSNADFATRVGYKCGAVPDFVTVPIPASTLRDQQLRTLSSQAARWAAPDRNAGLPDQAMRDGRTLGQVTWDLDQSQIRATRLPIQLHVCYYGPATRQTISGVDDDNSYLFWKGAAGPSEAALRNALAGYRHLERVVDLARVRLNSCPASLAEARELKAGPPLVQPAPPAPAPTPAVQRQSPRPTAPQPGRSPTAEERRRAAQEARCRNMERQLTALRVRASAGKATARALARSEAAYRSSCG